MRGLLLAGLLVFGTGHFAFGAVDWELEITDGTNTAIIQANGTLATTGSVTLTAPVTANPGDYSFNGTVGAYTVNVSTGLGSPLLPLGQLDLNSIELAGAATAPLTIEWSENGIATDYSAWSMSFVSSVNTGTVTNTAYESNTNGFFAQTNTIGTTGPVSGSFSTPNPSPVFSVPGVTGTYSLTEAITLNTTGFTDFSGNANLTPDPVPEPASVVLLGSVVSVTVIALRRRRLMKKALVD